MTKTPDEIAATLRTLNAGRVYGSVTADGDYFIRVMRGENNLNFGRFTLVASWRVSERMDEDPGSINCGCSLVGESHVHREATYDTAEAAAAAYLAHYQTYRTGRMTLPGGRVG